MCAPHCEDAMLRNRLITLFLALVPAIAAAQPGRAREELKQRVRTMKIAAIVGALDLDEQGAARLVPVLSRAYDAMAPIVRDSGEARRELRALLAAGETRPGDPRDDPRIDQLVERLLVDRQKMEATQVQMLRDARRVLSARQAARLVLVLPEVDRQIAQRIRRAAAAGIDDDVP